MSGLTYSRTAGYAILPGTWDHVRRHGNQLAREILEPADRYSYDVASPHEREQFDQLAALPLTIPPPFLVFALATSAEHIDAYQGEAPEHEGLRADGRVAQMALDKAADFLGITAEELNVELAKFSGVVTVLSLPAGSVLYRTIGLTTSSTRFGSVTNALLSKYWEARCPSDYPSIQAWRAATAVMQEWNGDFGYLKVVLSRPVAMLSGAVAMQKIARIGNKVLPGGGQQYYIPRFSDADLTEPLTGRALVDIVNQTIFSGGQS